MKKIFLLLGIFSIFYSCNTFTYKKIKIDNFIINNEIKIKDEDKKYVHGLYCKINGEINDFIDIELTNDDGLASHKIVHENGKINFIYNSDWYANEFIIKILSNNEPSGYINIVYRLLGKSLFFITFKEIIKIYKIEFVIINKL